MFDDTEDWRAARARKLADALSARLAQRQEDADTSARAWMRDKRAADRDRAAQERTLSTPARFGDEQTASERADIERLSKL